MEDGLRIQLERQLQEEAERGQCQHPSLWKRPWIEKTGSKSRQIFRLRNGDTTIRFPYWEESARVRPISFTWRKRRSKESF
jgi:hypothetical protein